MNIPKRLPLGGILSQGLKNGTSKSSGRMMQSSETCLRISTKTFLVDHQLSNQLILSECTATARNALFGLTEDNMVNG